MTQTPILNWITFLPLIGMVGCLVARAASR